MEEMNFQRMWYTLRHQIEEEEGLPHKKEGSVYELIRQLEKETTYNYKGMWFSLSEAAEVDYTFYPLLRSKMREIEKSEILGITGGIPGLVDGLQKIIGMYEALRGVFQVEKKFDG